MWAGRSYVKGYTDWRDPDRSPLSLRGEEEEEESFEHVHQQKKWLLQTDRAHVRTACVSPIHSVRPKRPPLRPVRPERPERPGILGLHLLRLVPPNTLVPVLTTRRTCHGLIPSEHPPFSLFSPGALSSRSARFWEPDGLDSSGDAP